MREPDASTTEHDADRPVDPRAPLGRRALLKGAAMAAGAAAATVVGRPTPASAMNGDGLVLGQVNEATSTTTLEVSGATGAGLKITANGLALCGESTGPMDPNDPAPTSGVYGLVGLVSDGTMDPNDPSPNAGVFGLAGPGGIGVLGGASEGPGVAGLIEGADLAAGDAFRVVGIYGGAADGNAIVGASQGGIGIVGVSGLAPNEMTVPVTTVAGVVGFAPDVPGVRGWSDGSSGVVGTLGNMPFDAGLFGAGVVGASQQRPGVWGFSDQEPGVVGESGDMVGVLGALGNWSLDPNDPNDRAGVYGISSVAPGVIGESTVGPGMRGISRSATRPGVDARNTASGGIGLQVTGRTILSTAGSLSIASGRSSTVVVNPAARSTSVIVVTFHTDPGTRYLKWIRRENGRFTVFLSGAAPRNLTFSYLILC